MATKTRMTGCSRFLFAMILIVPAAIIFSLWFTGKEITVENITDPSAWNDKVTPDIDIKKDENKPLRDLDEKIKEITNRDTKPEPEIQKPEVAKEEESESEGKRDIKGMLDDIKPATETEPEVADSKEADIEVPANSAEAEALQARISRLKDDLAEKDQRIEKLYQENEALRKRYDGAADSLVLIKGKLDKLKEALN